MQLYGRRRMPDLARMHVVRQRIVRATIAREKRIDERHFAGREPLADPNTEVCVSPRADFGVRTISDLTGECGLDQITVVGKLLQQARRERIVDRSARSIQMTVCQITLRRFRLNVPGIVDDLLPAEHDANVRILKHRSDELCDRTGEQDIIVVQEDQMRPARLVEKLVDVCVWPSFGWLRRTWMEIEVVARTRSITGSFWAFGESSPMRISLGTESCSSTLRIASSSNRGRRYVGMQTETIGITQACFWRSSQSLCRLIPSDKTIGNVSFGATFVSPATVDVCHPGTLQDGPVQRSIPRPKRSCRSCPRLAIWRTAPPRCKPQLEA